VFYDRSKNRSGRWCVMAECGNRAKVRAYRERERAKA
jgi:predicted RNA-binding Zn ribbon-like protein